jgi:prophage tail gpP-like protein
VKAGAKVQAFYGDELILTSVADAVNEACDRSGYGLKISGRDLVGQLIDCSECKDTALRWNSLW